MASEASRLFGASGATSEASRARSSLVRSESTRARFEQQRQKEAKFEHIIKVTGKVVSAKGLQTPSKWGKLDPYCVVKGIRSNNHLYNIFKTHVQLYCNRPDWHQEFAFECPSSWGVVELVGLKFLVYNAEDQKAFFTGSDYFLGGADVDLANLRRTEVLDLELGGYQQKHGVKKRPRLTVEITTFRRVDPVPIPLGDQLMQDMRTLRRVTGLEIHVMYAKNLRNADIVGKSDPFCVVSTVLMSGTVREIYRTAIIQDDLNPHWDELFQVDFSDQQEALLLVFDVYDYDDGQVNIPGEPPSGEHLGTAVVPLMAQRSDMHITAIELEKKAAGARGIAQKEKIDAAGLAGWLHKLKNLRPSGVKGLSFIKVGVAAERAEDDMPHAALLEKPFQIRDEDDILEIIEDPIWERSQFSDLRSNPVWQSRPVPPATLVGVNRIVWICGMIQGAYNLPSKDAMGKSDPYCIIEGLATNGDRLRIHRTRTINNKTSPRWHESFSYWVPVDGEVNRIVLSVFDSDEIEGVALLDTEDDFLGRATVDLAYLQNGEHLAEDLPLLGSNTVSSKQAAKAGSFRYNSSISIEIRVERRVQPVYKPLVEIPDYLKPQNKHTLARELQGDGHLDYFDPSQLGGPKVTDADQVASLIEQGYLYTAEGKDYIEQQKLKTMNWTTKSMELKRRSPVASSPSAALLIESAPSTLKESNTPPRSGKKAAKGHNQRPHTASAIPDLPTPKGRGNPKVDFDTPSPPSRSASQILPSIGITRFGKDDICEVGPRAFDLEGMSRTWSYGTNFREYRSDVEDGQLSIETAALGTQSMASTVSSLRAGGWAKHDDGASLPALEAPEERMALLTQRPPLAALTQVRPRPKSRDAAGLDGAAAGPRRG